MSDPGNWRVAAATAPRTPMDNLQCDEAHCLQLVPVNMLQSHRDQHLAERLAAEEFELHAQNQVQRTLPEEVYAALPYGEETESEDKDFLLAVALNRQFRQEEEMRFFRLVKVLSI
jgi:hypothetical protein